MDIHRNDVVMVFENLRPGDVFMAEDGDFYRRIPEVSQQWDGRSLIRNCIHCKTGCLYHFTDDMLVTLKPHPTLCVDGLPEKGGS